MTKQFRATPFPTLSSESTADFRREVLHGLSQPHKRLPCKYFYDQAGAELFERICELDEYYPTRCELAILQQHAPAVADCLGPGVALIEYGSGSSRKTRLLLDQLREPAAYLPVDINGDQLQETARKLSAIYPHLPVRPVEADFAHPFTLPVLGRPAARRVVYFSGSTIGNFEPAAARDLLVGIVELCGPGGGLLIGVDLKKDPNVLHAAYNDDQGVTAAFNRNLLARINRELRADFALDHYDHYAFYNPVRGRIEMHLVSRVEQIVRVAGTAFALAEGESICTEYSCKYSLKDFAGLASEARLRVRQVWLDERAWFSVQYLSVEAG
ncbi:MAG TPA: L-histidine N(alpha)-methyltransferase [Gemmataceae bacterium]|jgi:dimethylhistidine N-methyltransferase